MLEIWQLMAIARERVKSSPVIWALRGILLLEEMAFYPFIYWLLLALRGFFEVLLVMLISLREKEREHMKLEGNSSIR